MATYNKILLVDDDPTQAIVLQAYFLGLGCSTTFDATSARQALEILQEHDDIDLIVSDLMMPDMDGIELLRALKDCQYTGKVALISSLEQTIINSARKLGELHQLSIIGTCRKPLNRQALDELFQNKPEASPKRWKGGVQLADHAAVIEGLEKEQFVAHYQPKVNVLTKRIVGVEALARWEHPHHGLLSPDNFMPVVEAHHLTSQLTYGILRQVLSDMVEWQKEGLKIKVAVNVTAREVADLEFPDRINRKLHEFDIKPSLLALEVTENEVLEFNTVSLEVLARLRMMGIDIAIDDFGTGYSNLKTLREFPYTELKIDQSFIRGMTRDPFSQESVRTAATLGRQLNMRLLAEGVETQEEWDFIKQRGIDEVQGFLIAEPMSASDFTAFYHQNNGSIVLDDDLDSVDDHVFLSRQAC